MVLWSAGRRGALRGSAIVVGLVVTAGFLSVVSARVARPPLLVAIVRMDGLLVPIAVHDGTEWWNAWPFASNDKVSAILLPGSVSDMPKDWLPPSVSLPRGWTMWPLDRTGRREIRIRGFARPDQSIMEMIGLRTDLSMRRSEYAKWANGDGDAGIAVAGDGKIGRFVTPSTGGAEWRAILRSLGTRLDDAETEALPDRVRQLNERGRHPALQLPSAAQRRATPINGELRKALHTDADGTWYYFNASREYARRTTADCTPVTEFKGIFRREISGNLVVKSFSAFATDSCSCSESLQPLATLQWSGPTLWIVRVNVEDGFDYGLLDPNAADPYFLPMKGLWDLREANP